MGWGEGGGGDHWWWKKGLGCVSCLADHIHKDSGKWAAHLLWYLCNSSSILNLDLDIFKYSFVPVTTVMIETLFSGNSELPQTNEPSNFHTVEAGEFLLYGRHHCYYQHHHHHHRWKAIIVIIVMIINIIMNTAIIMNTTNTTIMIIMNTTNTIIIIIMNTTNTTTSAGA